VDKFEENSPEMYESLTDFQKFAGAVCLLREGGERSLFTMSEHNKYTYKLDNGIGCQKGISIIAGHL